MQTLSRNVKGRERRYTIEVFATLFGEWLVIRSYGSAASASPKGEIKSYHPSENKAQGHVETILHLKTKKGYRPLNQQ